MTTATMQRNTFPPGQSLKGPATARKASSKDPESKGIWLSMLDDVSRGKDLAEKQLVILGGTPTQQRELISTLNPTQPSSGTHLRRANQQRNPHATSKPISISNSHALGYTYADIPDTDNEDLLARLSVYMLSSPAGAFAPLLKPLFTAKTVPNTLITVLLDWGDVFRWAAELRQWIRMLRGVMAGLDDDVTEAMEETMKNWKERRVSVDVEGMARVGGADTKTSTVLLGPGEWEDELGVPLCVVCLHAEKQERMEKEFGWQEGDFDFVLQWLRCVLLKHGASLIYTTSFDSNNVRTLVQSTLGIHSLLKRQTIKHNVIDRDKILIPPNWDSWGKIRVLKEGFEIEAIASTWSVEIQHPPDLEYNLSTAAKRSAVGTPKKDNEEEVGETAVSIYVSSLPNPPAKQKPFIPSTAASDIVTVPDTQTFLAEQAQILDSLRLEDERGEVRSRKGAAVAAPPPSSSSSSTIIGAAGASVAGASSGAEDHSSPLNVNVGGIQVDAEEVTRRIREREADRGRERDNTTTTTTTTKTGTSRKERGGSVGGSAAASGQGSGVATPDGGKMQNEALANYFAGLMKKAKGASESPRGGGTSAGER